MTTHPLTVQGLAAVGARPTCPTCRCARAAFELLPVSQIDDAVIPGTVICTACINELRRAGDVSRDDIITLLPAQPHSPQDPTP